MHPEYFEAGPRGQGWYILQENGALLRGGPFPSEGATWAEIAMRASHEPESRPYGSCLGRTSAHGATVSQIPDLETH